MRSQFSHHYERPDDDEVNAALREAAVVLDTNVLLGLYRVSKELRTTRLKVLEAIGPRLFVPHQVGVEFHRNRREVAAGIGTAYETVRVAAVEFQKVAKAFGGGEGRYDETTTRVKELVNPLVKQIIDGLDELEKDDPHRIDQSDDPVLAQLEALLDDDQVGRAPRAKKLAKRARDFETVRVPLRLPPGFDDAHKITGRGVAAAAGDYLLWCEVLAYARKNGTDVVLITDDAKSDWWQKVPGGRDVPHPVLVSEFRRETSQRYYQLSTRELLRKADDALAISVTSQNLEEEDELAAAVEAERAMEQLANFRSRLTVSAAASAVENDLRQTFGDPWELPESDRKRLIDAANRAMGVDPSLNSRLHEIGHLIGSQYALTPAAAAALERLRQAISVAYSARGASEQEPPPEELGDEGTS
ncbi:PIN-like domain-containing protein [Cellulosimicrobium sp. KWT-B]|uniref:PIN-like domain-containing protein n=1 Tax=Cellulosimicrobium sp. KWT-B TaxID=1981152 RepID=UPI0011780A5A|nr:PIN-like domain-containing protein [Cellulosimicrobium sp. KWT-B]